MLVAIDGPAGAGKSTVARAAARALGFRYLDTGAMYRAAALAALRGSADADRLDIALEGERVVLDGEDVTDALRTPEVSAEASRLATRPEVREALVARQRALTATGDWVAEGRDVGTVVAPAAEVKVFLTASAEERARRRAQELGVEVERVLAEQRERDERDAGRTASPLRRAEGAVELDTTGLGVDEVVERVVGLVRGHG